MDLLKCVKIFFIRRDFRRRVNVGRSPRLVSVAEMRNVGLIFCHNEGSDYNDYFRIYEILKGRGLNYEVVVSNYVPEFAPSHPKLREHVVFMKEFHKDVVRGNKLLVDFIDNDFDLLIDMTNGGFENEYVVGLSKAKAKVGFSAENERYYDVYMVPRKGDTPVDTINAMFEYLDKFTK